MCSVVFVFLLGGTLVLHGKRPIPTNTVIVFHRSCERIAQGRHLGDLGCTFTTKTRPVPLLQPLGSPGCLAPSRGA